MNQILSVSSSSTRVSIALACYSSNLEKQKPRVTPVVARGFCFSAFFYP